MTTKLERNLIDLVSGYIKSQFSTYEAYDHFEGSLIKLMISFLGNILMKFDIYPSECKSLFSEDGLVFTRPGPDNNPLGSFTFGCSFGWNQGINKACIQVRNKFIGDAFGVTTNIEHFKVNKEWYSKGDVSGYFYLLYGSKLKTMNKDSNPCKNTIQRDLFCNSAREKDDKLSICLDANEWTVTWFKNDEQIGKSIKVMPNKTYHVFISSARYGMKYQLMIDD